LIGGDKMNAEFYKRVVRCDDEHLAKARLETMGKFLDIADILPVKSILAGIKD